MKTLTAVLAAAALVAPAAATAGSRINTPGTETRHEANLTNPASDANRPFSKKAQTEQTEEAKKEPRKFRPRAALAGKVNLATRSRN